MTTDGNVAAELAPVLPYLQYERTAASHT